MEYTLTIAEKKAETPDTVTICFRQPAFKKIKYRAGEYITVVVAVNGRKYRRPYSVSSVYGIDTTIDITVKEVPGGVVSGHIVHHWQPGDIITVMAPMGEYLLPPEAADTLFCWCAGSGITPNYAIIKEVLYSRSDVKQVVLVYGNRHYGTTIFKTALDGMVQAHPGRLKVYHVHSQPVTGEDAYYNSRLDADCVCRLLQHTGALEALHFICGPAAMNELVLTALENNGVAPEKVFVEHFGKYDAAALPEEVVTANAEVWQKDGAQQLRIARGSSLLDACLDAGVDVVYSCQSGSCGLCTARLLEGRVFTTQAPGYCAEGDTCLLCSSYPLTEQLSLQIL